MADTDPRSRRSRVVGWSLGAVAVFALVVAGVFAARDNGPSEVSVSTGAAPSLTEAPAPTSTAATQPPAPASTGAKGSGDPIAVSGTSPIDGEPVDLTAFRGKPVVLQIWASWCPGCNAEGPDVATLSKERTDVAFVGLNYRDTDSEARDFYVKYGWTFPSIRDASGDMALGLGLQGTPTTILLDAEHREVSRILGETTETGLTKAINQLTGGS